MDLDFLPPFPSKPLRIDSFVKLHTNLRRNYELRRAHRARPDVILSENDNEFAAIVKIITVIFPNSRQESVPTQRLVRVQQPVDPENLIFAAMRRRICRRISPRRIDAAALPGTK